MRESHMEWSNSSGFKPFCEQQHIEQHVAQQVVWEDWDHYFTFKRYYAKKIIYMETEKYEKRIGNIDEHY